MLQQLSTPRGGFMGLLTKKVEKIVQAWVLSCPHLRMGLVVSSKYKWILEKENNIINWFWSDPWLKCRFVERGWGEKKRSFWLWIPHSSNHTRLELITPWFFHIPLTIMNRPWHYLLLYTFPLLDYMWVETKSIYLYIFSI